MSVPALVAVSLLAAPVPQLSAATSATTPAPGPDPAAVRQEALKQGITSLARLASPPVDLTPFLNLSGGQVAPSALTAAQQLGKALFWDMQVGSDGQACGSCHFSAGTDSRTKNVLNPGNLAPTGQNVAPDTAFGNASSVLPAGTPGHPAFAPNYTLTPADFPFYQVTDPGEQNFSARSVLRDTNDRTSSTGVFTAQFTGVGQPLLDQGTRIADPVFHGGTKDTTQANVRRVEPRNTPSTINALFNEANFWDGRAHNDFNGVNPFGPLVDAGGLVKVGPDGALVSTTVSVANSSLASQAVGPPGNGTEMSFLGRPFPMIGRKLFALTPLGQQLVALTDSTLGPLSNAGAVDPCGANPVCATPVPSRKGLHTTYPALIKAAFQPQWWSAPGVVTGTAGTCPTGCSEMENNFSLFFGLAVQSYEYLLRADQSRFDRFMEGQNTLSADELKGFLVFMNRPGNPNPIFNGVGFGVCSSCHVGPALSGATVDQFSSTGVSQENANLLIEVDEALQLSGGRLSPGTGETFYQDPGFLNIGVRPTGEDLGRGGKAPNGTPLSFTRQALEHDPFAPPLPGPCPIAATPFEATVKPCPINDRVAVDGSFKIPQLRNVDLTGPYFHNGGEATLKEVTEFYRRRSDFGNFNLAQADDQLGQISFSPADGDLLVKFLLTLTDNRVKDQEAPFDQPQIFVSNGQLGDQNHLAFTAACPATPKDNVVQACDARLEIPAVGAEGRAKRGLPPLTAFLNVNQLDAGLPPQPAPPGPNPIRFGP